MEVMYRDQPADAVARRPAWLDLCAAGLLVAAVVLHLVAMFPSYFGGSIGQGSVWSQPDQAALYAVVTAGWALALGLTLSGPARIRLGAGIAVGLAVTEFGFRFADVGEALHYGVGQSSTGMWLMTAGWVAGAAGAIVAVLAVRRRTRVDGPADAATSPALAPAPIAIAGGEPPAPTPPVPSWVPQSEPRWAAPPALPPPSDPAWAPPGVPHPQPDAGWAPPGVPQPQPYPGWAPPGVPQPQPYPGWTGSGAPQPQTGPQSEPPGAVPHSAGPPAAVDRNPVNPWAPPPPSSAAAVDDVGGEDEGGTLPVPADPTASLPVDATAEVPGGSTTPLPVEPTGASPEPTTPFWVETWPPGVRPDGTALVPPAEGAPSGPYGARLTGLVALLALISAGAFLPAWDRYVGVVTTTGRTVSFSLGNAFSGPWPLVVGNVLVALALVAVPILGSRLRDRTVAASVVVGSLLVLAAQFTAAIVQANQSVPPSVAGLTPAQAAQLGLELHMTLTGWFTLDVLAAYGLFVAVMVIGYLRPAPAHDNPGQENSAGTWPTAPEARSPASLPWS